MAVLDFSKAFDRVWREELLLAASSKGLPVPFVRWLRDFVSNCATRSLGVNLILTIGLRWCVADPHNHFLPLYSTFYCPVM